MTQQGKKDTIFKAEKVLAYIKSIAQPRLVGSEGEKYVREFLLDKFRSFGLNVKKEEFLFSMVASVYLRIFLIILILCLTWSYVFSFHHPFISPIISLLALFALFFFLKFYSKLSFKNVKNVSSSTWIEGKLNESSRKELLCSNIIVSLNSAETEEKSKNHLYITAHYDSKSQSISLSLRVIISMIFLSAVIVLCLFFIFSGLVKATTVEPPISIRIAYFASLITAGILFFAKTQNRSPGALDNASGVSILLHLAEIFKGSEILNKIQITLVATGAEELGLLGAYAFCKKHLNEFKKAKGRNYFLNLDGLGTEGAFYVSSRIKLPFLSRRENRLLAAIREVSDNQKIKIKFVPSLLGADHIPFLSKGFDACTLSSYSRESWVIHTQKDRLENISLEGLRRAGNLICGLILRLGKD